MKDSSPPPSLMSQALAELQNHHHGLQVFMENNIDLY